MAIISATSIIRSLSIFHLTVAYFLLTSPTTIADHNLVFVLGAAMDLVGLSLLFYPLPPSLHSSPSLTHCTPYFSQAKSYY